jgi:transcriptional regulator with XRE-family HTH domain
MSQYNVKKLREERKITLRQLADSVHIADSALSRIENGRQRLYVDQAVDIADFFKVPVDEVIGSGKTYQSRIVYVDTQPTYETTIKALGTFSNKELAGLAGAIDLIMNQRENAKPIESKQEQKPQIKVIRQ